MKYFTTVVLGGVLLFGMDNAVQAKIPKNDADHAEHVCTSDRINGVNRRFLPATIEPHSEGLKLIKGNLENDSALVLICSFAKSEAMPLNLSVSKESRQKIVVKDGCFNYRITQNFLKLFNGDAEQTYQVCYRVVR